MMKYPVDYLLGHTAPVKLTKLTQRLLKLKPDSIRLRPAAKPPKRPRYALRSLSHRSVLSRVHKHRRRIVINLTARVKLLYSRAQSVDPIPTLRGYSNRTLKARSGRHDT